MKCKMISMFNARGSAQISVGLSCGGRQSRLEVDVRERERGLAIRTSTPVNPSGGRRDLGT